ncbi:CotY/CotZ family spore coat protein [Sporosarcina sp. FA9]|uniref:CotY/CotZ family spore coat protein n=1 Tax=Sporosarcina sp. FA9 TaxID=3413030 RepID=UPI003F65C577
MHKENTVCVAMKRLMKEQEIITMNDIDFQFICNLKRFDTIPFMLFSVGCTDPFTVHYKCVTTSHFRLEKIDVETCCATLSLLVPVDIEGNFVNSSDEYYALRKTKSCVIVNLNCFCEINPLPPELVGRPHPIVFPK